MATDELLTLKITTLTGKVIPIQCTRLETVEQLRVKIEGAEGIPADLQRLIFAGKELVSYATLASYNIENNCVIHMVLRKNAPPVASTAPMSDEEFARRLQAEIDQAENGNVPLRNAGYPPIVSAFPPMYQGQGEPSHLPIASDLNAMFINMPNMLNGRNINENVVDAYRFSKTVRMFAIMDAIFLIIFAFQFWPFIAAFALIIAGYYGAYYYNAPYLILYMIYLVLAVAMRIYFSISYDSLFYLVVLVLGMIIEIYIARLVYYFYVMIKGLTDEDRASLEILRYGGGGF